MTKRVADPTNKICPACGLKSVEVDDRWMFYPCLNQDCRSHFWKGTSGEWCYARDDTKFNSRRIFTISKGVLIIGEEVRLIEGQQ